MPNIHWDRLSVIKTKRRRYSTLAVDLSNYAFLVGALAAVAFALAVLVGWLP